MAFKNGTDDLKRADFGKDFIFGASTSNYQIEGGVAEGGRGPSTWDTFIQKYPYYILDQTNAKIAADSYHLFEEDVKALKNLGVKSYRFSISWSRILPGGTIKAGINREGIKYYNVLINQLIANQITPFVTLFHWDVPQALEDAYLSWLSPTIVKDFRDFAELCFWEFGDRVKYWITLNEPENFIMGGYVMGALAPGRGLYSPNSLNKVTVPGHRSSTDEKEIPILPASGDPGTEPYRVAHHMLIAHSEVVQTYKQKFKAQRGNIGITLVSEWFEPLTNTDVDKETVERALDFSFGWFMLPLVEGRYPARMVKIVGDRLPKFSDEQSQQLIGSYDFLGLNYYTGQYATLDTQSPPNTYLSDRAAKLQSEAADGSLIGPKLGTSTTCFYPEGLYKLLLRIKSQYGDPLIYITENGMDQKNEADSVGDLDDDVRTEFLQGHLDAIRRAKQEDVKVKGYFVWSLLDDFEWNSGYMKRMGIINVNFNDNCTRLPKNSGLWYMNFLQDDDGSVEEVPEGRGTKRALDATVQGPTTRKKTQKI